ncbi:medium-chain acyl-CoA ligase ACSF2, mitochondrial-like [Glandiceps talaboti]
MARTFQPTTSYIHAASPVPYTGMTLCDSLDRAAENFPDKEAFVFVSQARKQRITYKQFRHDVINLAKGLLHIGLKQGDRVGIWANNRYEWILTQYASAYMKMVYVRFPIGYKEEYMEHLINKTKISTLVVGKEQMHILSKIDSDMFESCARDIDTVKLPTVKTIILIDREEQSGTFRFEDMLKMGDENDLQEILKIRKTVNFDDDMCMMFTSGSTGFPKSVVVSHRCIIENINTLGHIIAKIVSGEDVCFTSMSPFAHVGGDGLTVMGPLCGFKIVVPDQASNAMNLATLIQEERITAAFLMFHFLYDFTNQSIFQSFDFSSLKLLYTGGNTVVNEVLEKARRLLTPNLYNFYGCTEAGAVTFNFNDAKFEKVGYPIDHQEIKVIDDAGNIVPLGTPGELCIRSPYVMLRYDCDEESTTAAISASRWYHTGDLCHVEEDGCLHIVGRKKDVIVKGGQNINPLEVERILIKHPKINLSQVVSVPDERLVEEVCACVCLEHGEEATSGEIQQFVASTAPDFLIPKYVLFYDTFPRSPVGKILRKELADNAKTRLGMQDNC